MSFFVALYFTIYHKNKEFKTSVLNSLFLTVAHQYSILHAHLNFRLSEWLLL